MKIIVEQFWQDLGEVEKKVQQHVKEALIFLRDNNKQNLLNGFTLEHERVQVKITGITEDYCLDVSEVGIPELLGMHIYEVESFDVYELLLLLREIKDKLEQ
jgi:hypothetical protein